ncbi:MAG: Asp-tRNA(Asn)/Glu-tRNA(Gln) amidotransferase GatCAB subunit B, partial [Caulobacteraceae bacterium]|nr:Asp-tRNA(Asn)/Glu-tRNA(Gln) amidotransferase GatCAB subunit B [Caulobacteraceae bacterium]
NSFRSVQRAIEFEIERQAKVLDAGGTVVQETRGYVDATGETVSQRSKEEAHDYRYFPDPDLLPLELDPAWVKAIEAGLPELPDAKKARLQSQYGLTAYDAGVLISDQAKADFYEAAAKGRDAKLVANWVTNDLAAKLTAAGQDIADSPISPAAIAELVALIEDGTISSKIAKDVFERMWAGEGSPGAIVEAQGLKQMSDTGELEKIVEDLIAANPGQAAAVKDKPQAIGWFVGQVMKATGGKANPGAVNQLLKAKLGL